MSAKTPENLTVVVKKIAEIFGEYDYVIRGTASLVLQGFDMVAADIDVLCDGKTALLCNALFKEYLIEPVKFSESANFKSFFGKVAIDGVPVEIMGEFQIKDIHGDWSAKFCGENPTILLIDGVSVKVTKPEDELHMFALMGRWNAFHKLKKAIGPVEKSQNKENNQVSLFI